VSGMSAAVAVWAGQRTSERSHPRDATRFAAERGYRGGVRKVVGDAPRGLE